MKLDTMKETVAKYAETISSVLNVTVTVVDQDLNRLGDTHHYPEQSVQVRENSILGQAVLTGKPQAFPDSRNCDVCRSCPDYDNCQIQGVLAVPVILEEQVVGGFCIIVPVGRRDLFDNVEVSIEFLENMADLLSRKLQSVDQLEAVQNAYREREVIMNAIDDALVSTDREGQIDYFNDKFELLFGSKRSSIGRNILDLVDQPVIGRMLADPYRTGGRLIYQKNPVRQSAFYGFVHCHPKSFGGQEGLLFSFNSLGNLNTAINEVFTHRAAGDFDWLEYHGAETKAMLNKAKQLAITDETILLCGEQGVGKEALAQAIHNFSDRSEGYYIQVNCDALLPDSLEEELFGHGSAAQQADGIGKLRLAHRGTLLLQGINRMPMYLQERLAHFLKTRRIGSWSSEEMAVDVRMIFTADEDLRALVEREHFSESLYYRISKNELAMPPLRQRSEADRRLLLGSAIQFYCAKYGKEALEFPPEILDELVAFDWPGNLQQLWDTVDRLVYSTRERVTQEQLRRMGTCSSATAVKSLDAIEREQIAVLLQNGYRKDDIAQMLNISRATLYRKLKKYNVR